jgi:CelD/BcsL family acetyltransferase involved in cellulose biosynthesis
VNVLSRRNQKNLFAKKKKLEAKGTISYKSFYGEPIEEALYSRLFQEFYEILKQRFDQKKVYNRDLSSWQNLKDKVYPLLGEKKASLFTIYDGPKLINVTLNFHLGNLICSHIQAFDVNYSDFNLPDIAMLKQLEWCYGHDIMMYDLMLGHTYYKEKWSNSVYRYRSQVFYRAAPLPTLSAYLLIAYSKTKLFLRKWIIPEGISMDRILFLFNGGNA